MSGGVGSPSSVRSYTQKVVGGSSHDLGDVDSMEEDTGSYHSAESPASSAQGAHATTPRYNQSPKASVTSIFKAKELFQLVFHTYLKPCEVPDRLKIYVKVTSNKNLQNF